MDYARCSDTTDHSSLSNYSELRVDDIALVWAVDFGSSTLKGTATLTLTSTSERLEKVVLDTRDLAVEGVSVEGKTAAFALGVPVGCFGQALTVSLAAPLAKGQSVKVTWE